MSLFGDVYATLLLEIKITTKMVFFLSILPVHIWNKCTILQISRFMHCVRNGVANMQCVRQRMRFRILFCKFFLGNRDAKSHPQGATIQAQAAFSHLFRAAKTSPRDAS